MDHHHHHHHSATHAALLVLADAGLPCPQNTPGPVCRAGPLQPTGPAPGPDAPYGLPSSGSREGIYTMPLPGVRCPTCAKDGKEVWVIPGRACGYCGTACG